MSGERSKEGRIRAYFKGEDIRGEDLKRNNPQEETSRTVSLIGEGTEGGDLEGNNKQKISQDKIFKGKELRTNPLREYFKKIFPKEKI